MRPQPRSVQQGAAEVLNRMIRAAKPISVRVA
jgi:hypothetical protein